MEPLSVRRSRATVRAVAQVGEVAVDAVAPRIAERLHLLRFAGDVVGFAVFDVAAGGAPLEVGVELDAVRRVDIDALHLPAQPFALGQAGHHLQAVAQDQAVRPVGAVAVEVGGGGVVGDAVEVAEQVHLHRRLGCPFAPHRCRR